MLLFLFGSFVYYHIVMMNNINDNVNINMLGNGVTTQEYSQQNEVERFSDRSKKVADIFPIEWRNWLFHKHYIRHEYKLTIELIDEELHNSNNRNEYANCLKGLIFRREGKIQESLNCFRDSYVINCTNVHHVKNIAKSLFLLGDHRHAIDAYLEAEKMLNSPDWEIHLHLGSSYMALRYFEQASSEILKAMELTNDKVPHMLLTQSTDLNKGIEQAIQLHTRVIQTCNDRKEAKIELGFFHLQQGDILKAFQEFGTVLAHLPTCVEAILPTAYIIQNHHEYDIALAKYKNVTHSSLESWQIWNNIGMCFCGKHKYLAAITCLKRAFFLNSMAWQPACNLGRVFLMTDQPASAAIHLSAAISTAPQNYMPYLLLGLALKKLNDNNGAERALLKAHLISPNDPFVLVNYAIILQIQNKSEHAAEMIYGLKNSCVTMNINSQVLQAVEKLSCDVTEVTEI